ncbi:Pycsar system effector family protein [Pedobacter immunditicola]|uniref:Pycsar system effector family protein n=1 Tax=Pedobacter immunditicola TaxID=3133440 RepID=UPI0030A904D0
MNYLETLDQVKAYVTGLFQTGNDQDLLYHNISHTEEVVENAVKIASNYQLSDRDFFVLMAACWFHDVGYLQGLAAHELVSADRAKEFLAQKNVPQDVIQEVEACIMATRMPQKPVNLLQQIICDADLYHLGTEVFKERSKTLRKEFETFCKQPISKEEWRCQNLKFLQAHQFHTTYGKQYLNEGKAENLEELKKKSGHDVQKSDEDKVENKKVKKEKNDRPDKGIETMFRITSNNHQRLSDMADNKAHIMISTNAIILSILLSVLLRRLENNPHLIIPTIILLVICVVTMVFSILATRPSIPSGTFTQTDIQAKSVNLLFFGNFYKMSLKDYENGMEKVMEDREFLYGSLIMDLHGQGVVLGRKYRLLRVAYNVFMYGIIAAVLSFIIALIWVAL